MAKDKPRSESEQLEIFNKDITPTNALQALMDLDPRTATPEQIKDIMLAVRAEVAGTGVSSIPDLVMERMDKYFEKLDQRLKAVEAFNKDQAGFIEEVYNRSEKVQVSDKEREEIRARVAKEQSYYNANVSAKRQDAQRRLAQEPHETVVWPGKMHVIRSGESQRPVISGEVVRLYGIKFSFPPGKTVRVPQSVAERLRELSRSESEQNSRKGLLDASASRPLKEETEVVQRWEEINRESGSSADSLPMANG